MREAVTVVVLSLLTGGAFGLNPASDTRPAQERPMVQSLK